MSDNIQSLEDLGQLTTQAKERINNNKVLHVRVKSTCVLFIAFLFNLTEERENGSYNTEAAEQNSNPDQPKVETLNGAALARGNKGHWQGVREGEKNALNKG